ncbi:MAG: hypothetical protein H0T53_14780 [Herpetosiphonaceae bacterium]|nr:hypothetical protein [Herpetosiphonaceae bacterium]
MSNDSELRTYEDVRRILTAVLDFVARREVQEETRRHDDATISTEVLGAQAELYRLKALRACCDAALLCGNDENLTARPAARGALAAVDAWHEVEKRRHEAEQAAKRTTKRTTKAQRG